MKISLLLWISLSIICFSFQYAFAANPPPAPPIPAKLLSGEPANPEPETPTDVARIAWGKTKFTFENMKKYLLNSKVCLLSQSNFRGCFFAAEELIRQKDQNQNRFLSINTKNIISKFKVIRTLGDFTIYELPPLNDDEARKSYYEDIRTKVAEIDRYYNKYFSNVEKMLLESREKHEENLVSEAVAIDLKNTYLREDVLPNLKMILGYGVETFEKKDFPEKGQSTVVPLKEEISLVEQQINENVRQIARLHTNWFEEPFETPARVKPILDMIDNASKIYGKESGPLEAQKLYNTFLVHSSDGHSSLKIVPAFLARHNPSKVMFYGINVTVDQKNNEIYIDPMPGGAAYKAGLRRNDRILSVNGEALKTENKVQEFVSKAKGPRNVVVNIEVERWKTGEVLTASVLRSGVVPIDARLDTKNAHGKKIGYITLPSFNRGKLAERLKPAIELKEKEVDAWVIDLQDNPGGYLLEVVKLLDQFLDKDKLLVTQARDYEALVRGDTRSKLKTHFDPVTRKPLVVVINERSASASEIFSGTIKEQKRGLIIGSRSFGKGSVQGAFFSNPIFQNVPLSAYFFAGILFRKTQGYYFLGSGFSPQWTGIEPDIEVGTQKDGRADSFVPREKEAFPLSLRTANPEVVSQTGIDLTDITPCLKRRNSRDTHWERVKDQTFKPNYRQLYAIDAAACLAEIKPSF